MNAGPSGFQNAPVTKGIVLVCGAASLLVGTARGSFKTFGLSYQSIVRKFQLWRLLPSTCIFSTTSELVFGISLIYFFRVFERQIGSNKYAVFAFISTTISAILEIGMLTALQDPTASGLTLSPGPYGFIFASFVPFFFDIPVSTRFRIFGIQFSDKSIIYLAGLQLLLASWKQSLIPGLCGILAGFTYRSNIFGLRRLKFPDAVTSLVSRIFGPFLSGGSGTTARANGPRAPATTGGRQPEGRFVASPPSVAAALSPPEESVATLVSMGFDRNMALQALARARNDLTMATNILLESQSH